MLYIMDLDGTLIEGYMDRPDKAYFPTTPLPGRVSMIRNLREVGQTVAIVTNQAGVAFGYVTEEDWHRRLADIDDLFFSGGPDFSCVCCMHHPDATEERWRDPEQLKLRKPSGGGIRKVMAEHPEAAAEGVVYVGDRPEDEQAAADAGVPFMWAEHFFADG